MRICWKCGKLGATVPDPCCSAHDCEHKLDYIHEECVSEWYPEQYTGYHEVNGAICLPNL